MRRRFFPQVVLFAVLAAPAAQASVVLLANGTLTGSAAGPDADLSGLTGTMENGVPANILGGMGSGLAYAGGNTFLALPDRGPNATAYNSNVDDTVSYIARFHTLTMDLTPNAPGAPLPFTLAPTLNATTLLSSPTPLAYGSGAGLGLGSGAPAQNGANTFYFTGRSDNFDQGQNSGNPLNGRFDPEAIRVAGNGKSVFVSDEYGPYVYEFDKQTGKRLKAFTLPSNLAADHPAPTGAAETAGNASGRTPNRGMEGLAITPDGKTLVGVMQSALIQDAASNDTKKLARIVTIDIATGDTRQYGYQLTDGSGISEIVAINDHEFLLDERDGKGLGDGSNAQVKKLYKIDLAGAADITNLSGSAAANAAVGKTQFLDLVQALMAEGITPDQLPAKIEGVAFGQDVTLNGEVLHTLYIANDNDFLPNVAGPNRFYVFGFKDVDLPGYQPVSAVPVPNSIVLLGSALAGLMLARRRKE